MSVVTLPELLLPAGNLSKLKVAYAYGADACYVGAAGFSMRPDGSSFSIADLEVGLNHAHAKGKKLYVALNSMMFDEDFSEIQHWLSETQHLRFDALIVSDAGVFQCVKDMRPELPLHISTQMSTANSQAAAFWKAAGAERVVLARECSLEQARIIADESGIDVEIFVHGAMCVAVSGRCLLSAYFTGKDANKGQCKQSCRWDWQLVEKERPGEAIEVYEDGRETIFLSSKDLCLIEHIPAVVQSKAASLKIEGRMKSEYYVASVARVYREALDRYADNPENFKVDPIWIEELEAVSHRPYETGFAFGYPHNEPERLQSDSKPLSSASIIGFVEETDANVHLVSVKNPFSVGESLEWIGPGMRSGEVVVESIINEKNQSLERSICGTKVQASFSGSPQLPKHTIFRKRK